MQNLLLVIDRAYSNGIKKFKTSTHLRLDYAFFLLERFDNKKKALEHLNYAETLKPTFDEQFLIYRYKKIIEDKLEEKETDKEAGEEIDIVSAIAYETHLKLCEEHIQRASKLHKEFWQELIHDTPDLLPQVNMPDLIEEIRAAGCEAVVLPILGKAFF